MKGLREQRVNFDGSPDLAVCFCIPLSVPVCVCRYMYVIMIYICKHVYMFYATLLEIGTLRPLKETHKGNFKLYFMVNTHSFECINRTFCK